MRILVSTQTIDRGVTMATNTDARIVAQEVQLRSRAALKDNAFMSRSDDQIIEVANDMYNLGMIDTVPDVRTINRELRKLRKHLS